MRKLMCFSFGPLLVPVAGLLSLVQRHRGGGRAENGAGMRVPSNTPVPFPNSSGRIHHQMERENEIKSRVSRGSPVRRYFFLPLRRGGVWMYFVCMYLYEYSQQHHCVNTTERHDPRA